MELQVEVKISNQDPYSLDETSLKKFHSVLRSNSKTEEIIVVWASNELDSMALGLDDVQDYLSVWQANQQPIEIQKEDLRPFLQTVLEAFTRYRPRFWKPKAKEETREVDFDPVETFSRYLDLKLSELKDSVQRRRAVERIIAIESISVDDKEEMYNILDHALRGDIEVEELRELIEAISRKIDIDNYTQKE